MSPLTKWHLGDGHVAMHKVYYKGEGGGFPQVRVVVSLVSPCLAMTCSCTKVLELRTNQLVVWFVQVCVNDWSACQSSWSHPKVLTCPSTPKVLRAKECAPTPFHSIIHLWTLSLSPSRSLGVCQVNCNHIF